MTTKTLLLADVLIKVMSFLDPIDIERSKRVCKDFLLNARVVLYSLSNLPWDHPNFYLSPYDVLRNSIECTRTLEFLRNHSKRLVFDKEEYLQHTIKKK